MALRPHRILLGAAWLCFQLPGLMAAEPLSVYPKAIPSQGSSLNESLPQALQGSAPSVLPGTLISSPSWAVTGPDVVRVGNPTYLNTAPASRPTESVVSYGLPSATKPYRNFLAPPVLRTATSCATGTCRPRGNALERLKAWLSFRVSDCACPTLSLSPYQAPMQSYFPCTPGAAGCATGACQTGMCATGACTTERARLLPVFNRPAANDCTSPYPLAPLARPIYRPFATHRLAEPGYAGMPGCTDGGCPPRLGAFRRILNWFHPNGCGARTGCLPGMNLIGLGMQANCGIRPSIVRFAHPTSAITQSRVYSTRSGLNVSAMPAAMPQMEQPAPVANPPLPMPSSMPMPTPSTAPNPMPTTGTGTGNGTGTNLTPGLGAPLLDLKTVPGLKQPTQRSASELRPFTNP